jgi:integral membrane protein (TIGR01906 family)
MERSPETQNNLPTADSGSPTGVDVPEAEPSLPIALQRLLQAMIVLTLPLVLALGSVRLVMTPVFLSLEYHRPGFPEDLYGFSTDDRLKYGPYGVRYLTNDEDISYLADLTINGDPAFTSRELAHMEDVQAVTRVAFRVLMLTGALLASGVILLARKRQTRPALRRGLQAGGGLTILLIVMLTAVVLINWDFFFDAFHELFFAEGTWRFYMSDTLIRLYPEQFWFDISLTVGLLTIGGALACILIPWRWEKSLKKQTSVIQENRP